MTNHSTNLTKLTSRSEDKPMNKRMFAKELTKTIDENLDASRDLMVGIVLKGIARELSSFDLDRDDYKLPNHPLARLIYLYVDREIKRRLECKQT